MDIIRFLNDFMSLGIQDDSDDDDDSEDEKDAKKS